MPHAKDDDFEFEGFRAPSYTQVPDEAFDVLMARLSPAEFKVMMYIVRRTFGFKKGADAISLSQIVAGVKTRDGRWLDLGTGLTRRGVTKALAELVRRKVILAERRQSARKGYEATVYRLNIIGDLSHFPDPDDPRMQPLHPPQDPPRELSSLGLGNSVPQAREPSSLEQETDVQDTEEQQQHTTDAPKGSGRKGPESGPPGPVVVASFDTGASDTAGNVASRLAALGVAQSSVKSLLNKQDPAVVERWIAYAEHKLASGWVPRESPAAWLVSAIRSGDWVIPEWFVTAQEKAAEEERASAEQRAVWAKAEERERQAAARQRAAVEQHLGIGERTSETWDQVRALLRERGQFSPALFASYLLPLRGSTATIVTPVEIFRRFVESRSANIATALSKVTGRPVENVEVQHVALPAKLTGETKRSR